MTPCLTTGPRTAVVRFVFTALLFLSAGSARAQDGILQPAPDRVDVVALMVEFQPDTTRFTTGNGTFAGPLFPGVDAPKIDPLPHNAAYFDAHLRFLEHYVGRVSDGQTTVTTHLLPDVVRVSKPMGAYSPTGHEAGSDAELVKLSALVKEAWTLADQSSMVLPAGLDPATTAFVIFHAGVGRDIELVGTTLDKTPEDIPSIFFGDSTLQRLGTAGIAMDGFPITNSLIIPRTESRMGVNPLTQEPFLIELSINGMLAASFFNWLGVPDLFNTEDGSSAIGPFGLMDALGIFAYSGLFPPEPSAWTKQFLGWSHYDGWNPPSGQIHLTNAGRIGRNGVVRIEVSGSEYFLVENRHRDPQNDGVRLRVWSHEGEHEVIFVNGDPEFNDRTVSGFPGGVILSVDEYDFALPGGVDENDNPLLGGILIWHVDENRLAAGFADNRVNADPDARAIDLEEADGAQDIGFGSGGGFFSANFDLGTPFDFWYEGNPVTVRTASGQDIRLYQNRFASDTEPSSRNNRGGPTGIVLSDFSPPGTAMSFTLSRGADGSLESLGPVELFPTFLGNDIRITSLVPNPSGTTFLGWSDGVAFGCFFGDYRQSADIRPALLDEGLFLATNEGLSFVSGCDITDLWAFSADSPVWTTASMEWVRLPGQIRLYAGIEDASGSALGTFTIHDGGNVEFDRVPLPETARFLFVESHSSARILVLTDTGVYDGQGERLLDVDLSRAKDMALAGPWNDWTLGWTQDATGVGPKMLRSDGSTSSLAVDADCISRHSAWHDLDGDGKLDLSYTCGREILAVHGSGAMVEGFPLRLPTDVTLHPAFARDGSGRLLTIANSSDGYAWGLRLEGLRWEQMEGFPISVGAPVRSVPLLNGDSMILAGPGMPVSWRFQTFDASRPWDIGVMVAQPAAGPVPGEGNRLLVAEETYNWPNPIRSGSTRIRFEVQETSFVEIDIVDPSGMRVDHLEVDAAPAGMPTEVIWQTGAGSGVYLARVKARSLNGGRTDTRLIRMAIIR